MDLWRRNVKRRIEMRGGGAADSVPVVNNPVFPSPPYPFNDVIMNCNYPFDYMIFAHHYYMTQCSKIRKKWNCAKAKINVIF